MGVSVVPSGQLLVQPRCQHLEAGGCPLSLKLSRSDLALSCTSPDFLDGWIYPPSSWQQLRATTTINVLCAGILLGRITKFWKSRIFSAAADRGLRDWIVLLFWRAAWLPVPRNDSKLAKRVSRLRKEGDEIRQQPKAKCHFMQPGVFLKCLRQQWGKAIA